MRYLIILLILCICGCAYIEKKLVGECGWGGQWCSQTFNSEETFQTEGDLK